MRQQPSPDCDRSLRTPWCEGLPRLALRGNGAEHSTEPSFAPLILQERKHELAPAKVGPQGRRRIEFRIGQLLAEKVADACFSAGPDQEVRIGELMSIEILLDQGFIHIFRL